MGHGFQFAMLISQMVVGKSPSTPPPTSPRLPAIGRLVFDALGVSNSKKYSLGFFKMESSDDVL